MDNSKRIQTMRNLLTQQLSPTYLEIIDDSHLHQGHIGAQSGAGHFTIKIAAKQFEDKKLIEQHRLVYQALQPLMPQDIHALIIKIM
ncbi:MAG: BolA family transcriptional regulator [Legionellales bacterium]|nr:BolA family transcriptional regulator [Legionellales bacterium]